MEQLLSLIFEKIKKTSKRHGLKSPCLFLHAVSRKNIQCGVRRSDMEHYLLIARSVTHAQRMEKALRDAGVRATVLRAPTQINPKGCSYAVRIDIGRLERARAILSAMKAPPIHVDVSIPGGYQEVML